jgi:hypothetical protein
MAEIIPAVNDELKYDRAGHDAVVMLVLKYCLCKVNNFRKKSFLYQIRGNRIKMISHVRNIFIIERCTLGWQT